MSKTGNRITDIETALKHILILLEKLFPKNGTTVLENIIYLFQDIEYLKNTRIKDILADIETLKGKRICNVIPSSLFVYCKNINTFNYG